MSPTPTTSPTPSVVSTATPGPVDHFLCYETHRRQLNKKNVAVDSSDPDFGNSTVVVRQAKRLCAPVNKNNEPQTVAAPGHPGHLTFYTIRQTAPRFVRVKDLTIEDQFGEITVDLVRPERMLVPTSKSLVSTPPPLATPLDHYKCYRVRGARVRKPNVNLWTQFNPDPMTDPPVVVAIKRPRDLCIPVNKTPPGGTPSGIGNPQVGLMCYQVRTLPLQGLPRVYTTDQFGSDDYDLFGVRDLCVPLKKGPGICGDGALNSPGEQCETGTGNDAACPGNCDTQTCTCPEPPQPVCGNGTVESGEACESSADCITQCAGRGGLDCFTRAVGPIGPTCVDCQCVPPAPLCGDGILNGDEQCDGTDSFTCPFNCDNSTCLCAICGDGVRNGTEQCDGADDGSCPGVNDYCVGDCTCCQPTCPLNACDTVADGCGGTIDCGTCPLGMTCELNQCVVGIPCAGIGDGCDFDDECCSEACCDGTCCDD